MSGGGLALPQRGMDSTLAPSSMGAPTTPTDPGASGSSGTSVVHGASRVAYQSHATTVTDQGLLRIAVKVKGPDGEEQTIEKLLRVKVGEQALNKDAVASVVDKFASAQVIRGMVDKFLENAAMDANHKVVVPGATKLRFLFNKDGFCYEKVGAAPGAGKQVNIGAMTGAHHEQVTARKEAHNQGIWLAQSHVQAKLALDRMFEGHSPQQVVQSLEKIIGEGDKSIPLKSLSPSHRYGLSEDQNMRDLVSTSTNRGLFLALKEKLEAAKLAAQNQERTSIPTRDKSFTDELLKLVFDLAKPPGRTGTSSRASTTTASTTTPTTPTSSSASGSSMHLEEVPSSEQARTRVMSQDTSPARPEDSGSFVPLPPALEQEPPVPEEGDFEHDVEHNVGNYSNSPGDIELQPLPERTQSANVTLQEAPASSEPSVSLSAAEQADADWEARFAAMTVPASIPAPPSPPVMPRSAGDDVSAEASAQPEIESAPLSNSNNIIEPEPVSNSPLAESELSQMSDKLVHLTDRIGDLHDAVKKMTPRERDALRQALPSQIEGEASPEATEKLKKVGIALEYAHASALFKGLMGKTGPHLTAEIMKMSAEDRAILKKGLVFAMQDNPMLGGARVLKTEIENNLIAAKDFIHKLTTLSKFVDNGQEISIAHLLILNNEAVISNEDLFNLIHSELGDPNKLGSEKQKLLGFTLTWAKANQSMPGFEGVKPILQKIATEHAESANPAVQGAAEQLHELLAAPQASIAKKPLITDGALSFSGMLSDLKKTRLEGRYEQTVTSVAADFTKMQNAYKASISPMELVQSKWPAGSPNVKNYRGFQNQVSYFVSSQVLNEREPEAQRRLIKFFINIAAECLKSGDAASAKAIYSALSQLSNTDAKGVLAAVQSDRDYKPAWDKLAGLATFEPLPIIGSLTPVAPKSSLVPVSGGMGEQEVDFEKLKADRRGIKQTLGRDYTTTPESPRHEQLGSDLFAAVRAYLP